MAVKVGRGGDAATIVNCDATDRSIHPAPAVSITPMRLGRHRCILVSSHVRRASNKVGADDRGAVIGRSMVLLVSPRFSACRNMKSGLESVSTNVNSMNCPEDDF